MEPYLLLKLAWWLMLGVLLTGIAVMMGADMGVGAILRWVGRSDDERRVALNVIGPHWDGNQVWFILGGGAIFAAWPLLYATAFSGMYVVMLALLWSMIIRPLGFEYRSKLPSPAWRNVWDWVLFVSGVVPMWLFGVVMGNLFIGVPFRFSWDLASSYGGDLAALFHPFALFSGVLSVTLAVLMGSVRLTIGAEGMLYRRARMIGQRAALLAAALFAVGGPWVMTMAGYRLLEAPPPAGVQTPLQQSVILAPGAWSHNFIAHPWAWLLPLSGCIALVAAEAALAAHRSRLAWWLGALGWVGVIGSCGVALFPFLLPSSSVPAHSLTVWNAAAGRHTLGWVLGFALLLLPLIVWYTRWALYTMRGKVRIEQLQADEHAY